MKHCERGKERDFAEKLDRLFAKKNNPILQISDKVAEKPKIPGKVISYVLKLDKDISIYLKYIGTIDDYIPIYIIPYEDEGFILLRFLFEYNNGEIVPRWNATEFSAHYVDRFVERHLNDYTNLTEIDLYTTIALEFMESYKEFSDEIFIAFSKSGVSLGHSIDKLTWIKLNTYVAEEDLFKDQKGIFDTIIKECNIEFSYFDIPKRNSEVFKRFIKKSGLYIESGLKLNYKFRREIYLE